MPQIGTARAVIAQQLNVVDKHVIVTAPQSFFYLQDGHSIEDLPISSTKKSKQGFEPWSLLQFEPCAPRVIVERARREVCNPVVVRNSVCLKKRRDQTRMRARTCKLYAETFAMFV